MSTTSTLTQRDVIRRIARAAGLGISMAQLSDTFLARDENGDVVGTVVVWWQGSWGTYVDVEHATRHVPGDADERTTDTDTIVAWLVTPFARQRPIINNDESR